ncbi:hypothetical protein RN001_013684 [Aquatica leii]|uniref:GPI inositol-deacylase n=1 Tax=Aquatica leii TaxID=1421715 RepID=A0AAN7PQX8_9COLE|nr:hypothetical protein RN001_013684 [Aquatica leii]
MALISGFIVFSLIITFAYLLGLLTFLTDQEKNGCEMTYMYAYPQFVRIHVEADLLFKKYGLYSYSEGRSTENARNMKFTGIPVLFIPGNAGSFKQVRSFASVALRKSLDIRPGFHFDFFAVDLNDEFSGLNGALLYEQTQYVNHTITRILELYNSSVNHKNLILMGHSMGGIIARGIVDSVYDKNILPLVITLAAPHARPPLLLDTYMNDYYNQMQKSISSNNTIIALSGGYSDYVVVPFITSGQNFEHLHVITTSVPLVWLPVDHLCILWCKQLVLAVTRGLFDLVDLRTKQITLDNKYQRAVFEHHLVKNNGLKIRKLAEYSQSIVFSSRGEWIENLQKHYTVSLKNGAKQVQWHMIRLLNEEDYRYLTIVAINLEVTDWIFACAATHVQGQRRICTEGIHVSHLSEIAPSAYRKRRTLYLDTHELKRNYTDVTHIVVKVLPTSDNVLLHIDRFIGDDRRVQVNLPSSWSFKRDIILNETQEKFVHYDFMINQLQHIIQCYKLYVEPIKCNSNIHQATVTLVVPWGNQDIHKHITEGDRTPFTIRLHQSRPLRWNVSFPSIHLALDPSCRYSISIKNDIFGVLGQIARSYSSLLIGNMAAVLLLTLRNQLVDIQKTGSCSTFFNAIQHGIKPYYILPLVKIASRGLSWKGFSKYLPLPDWHIIIEEGNEFLLLSLILYVTSVGIVWLVALGIAISLIFCESTFHKLTAKFLARALTGSVKISDWLLGGFHKIPEIVATILVILSITTCGGLSLCLGCIFYFLKLTQMSQDYVEQIVLNIFKYLVKKFRRNAPSQQGTDLEETESSQNIVESSNVEDDIDHKKCLTIENNESTEDADIDKEEHVEVVEELSIESVAAENESETGDINENGQNEPVPSTDDQLDYNAIFFHFSIFLLWCIVTAINIPSVLTWAHNFKYNTMLQPDPSFVPGMILSLCALPLWHMDLPKRNIYGYSQLAQLLNILSGMSLIYASLSLYRLNYIITLTVVLVTLHQLFSWERENREDLDDTTNTQNPETLYSDIKAKWE